MPTITKKQLEDYNKLCEDRTYGRILTPDGLRMICEANNYDPKAIGKQMLETYAKFKNKVVPGDTLTLEVEIIKEKGPMGVGRAKATNQDGKVAVIAELTFAVGA